MYYIDIDWNEVFVYKNNLLIHKESSMILRNLKDEQLLFIGNLALEHLREEKNLLAIIPIENKKILSYENLNLLLEYIVNKLNIEKPYFVNRYNADVNELTKSVNIIEELDFIKEKSEKNIYIELRNNETLIFNLQKKEVKYNDTGYYKLLRYISKSIYMNYNGLLNTKKTIELFKNLLDKKFEPLLLKEVSTGKEIKVEKYNRKMILCDVIEYCKKITSEVQEEHCLNTKFKEVVDGCN